MNAGMRSRCVWMVPECKVEEGVRPDTYEEMINYAYQGIVNGARGLIYYNLDNLLRDKDYKSNVDQSLQTMQRVGEHLNAITPIALGIDYSPDTFSLASMNPKVWVLTRLVGDKSYAIAVNPYNETVDVEFKMGEGAGMKQVTVGLPGNPEKTIDVINNSFSDRFEPLGTRVYLIN
jgi:hypothetical protein